MSNSDIKDEVIFKAIARYREFTAGLLDKYQVRTSELGTQLYVELAVILQAIEDLSGPSIGAPGGGLRNIFDQAVLAAAVTLETQCPGSVFKDRAEFERMLADNALAMLKIALGVTEPAVDPRTCTDE